MSKGKWFNNIARVIKKKNGGYFLAFERAKDKNGNYIGESPYPMTINEGDILQMRLKKDDLAGLVSRGIMTQAIADKICENVKFEVSKPPAADQSQLSDGAATNDKDEVNF
jgi:hypothetical protein